MNHQKRLDELIVDLHSHIDAMGEEDARAAPLRNLAEDIQTSNGARIDTRTLATMEERLGASILEFEGTHPRIAMVLNELVEKLGAIGI